MQSKDKMNLLIPNMHWDFLIIGAVLDVINIQEVK